MNGLSAKGWFMLAVALELALLAGGFLAGWLLGRPLTALCTWRTQDAVVGLLAAVPMLGGFWWMQASTRKPLVEIRALLEPLVRSVFKHWSWRQIALVSALAGAGEECFFRGFLQAGLTPWLGDLGAIAAASLVFGLAHPMSRAYVLLAAGIGAYLGLLLLVTGGLLASMVAHGLYDFLVLVYLVRQQKQRQPSSCP